jgi:hypothetical protein
MSFLPDSYEAPKSGGSYMKLQDGENKIRILSKPIIGWLDWEDRKPKRFRMDKKPLAPVDPMKAIKHFWAFIVWNYTTEQIEVMEITQRGIQKAIQALSVDEDWKEPFHYDLKITRKGEGLDTEYFVNPSPHKPVGSYVEDMFHEKRCYLDALFDGADPFDSKWLEYTPGVFEKIEETVVVKDDKPKINSDQLVELTAILGSCDPLYCDELKKSLKKLFNSERYEDIPSDMFDRIKIAALKKKAEYELNNQELPF